MARHRRFADGAGFTRHCWECVHAKGWRKTMFGADIADCELTNWTVERYDSPNNQCSYLPPECDYDEPDNSDEARARRAAWMRENE